jgi:hypothetical protein
MRDAARKNPRDYRKEEWIAYGVEATEVDAIARRQARGRFFVCVLIREGESDKLTRSAYKSLGYRLLATEGFFVQSLKRISNLPPPVPIERVCTPELAGGWEKQRGPGRSQRAYWGMRPRSGSMWPSTRMRLWGGCEAWTPSERPGAPTCM